VNTTTIGGLFDASVTGFERWTPLLWDPVGAATCAAADPRPGGRMAVTTWQAGSVEPVIGPFAQAAEAEQVAAGRAMPAPLWRRESSGRVDSAGKLSGWLSGIGADGVDVTTFGADVPLTPELGWELCTGSAARILIDGLDADAVARIRARYLAAPLPDAFKIRALIGTGTRPTG